MGVVYAAEDTRLGRQIALKFIADDALQNPETLARFEREARLASGLNHPHICTIYDVQSGAGRPFIAMELLRGETLLERVRGGPLPTSDIIEFGYQVADALSAAHALGMVHRDIKSANVFITERGLVKILDFGLAKIVGPKADTDDTDTIATVTSAVSGPIGTIQYMSPEQLLSKPIDGRSDLFAVGILLYEMTCGKLPFGGDTKLATVNSVLNDQPKFADAVLSSRPAPLLNLIVRLMQKDRELRVQTADGVRDELALLRRQLQAGALAVGGATNTDASLAVLPFRDLGPDPDNEYLCDGLAEELVSSLSRLPNLRVASRTSAFAFKGRDVNVQSIGHQLHVSAILEGSVRKSGARMRTTVQLVNVSDGYTMWSERFDRTVEDVFAVQDEIALAIVDQLKVKLGMRATEAPLIARYTDNHEAYHLYLRGRYHWAKRYQGGMVKALECFTQAIALDPDYALAHAGLADAYAILAFYTLAPPKATLEKARASAHRALAIDPKLAEAHVSLALILLGANYDVEGALREFEVALVLNPRQPLARAYYSWLLVILGRVEEALIEAGRARDEDPMSQTVLGSVAYTHFLARRYEQAIAECDRCLEIGSGFLVALYIKGMSLGQLRRHDEAIATLEEAATLSDRAPFYLALLGAYHARAGHLDRARQLLAEVESDNSGRYTSPHVYTYIYAGLGDLDRAFAWQEKAIAEGVPPFNLLSPSLAELHQDPRHLAHLKTLGLKVDLSDYLKTPSFAPAQS